MGKKRTETFLRSINLIYDAGSPESVSHFYPTAKTVPLINAILGNAPDRSTFVIAPYGSGKSLTAAYALHLIENTPPARSALMPVAEKFQKFDSDLCKFSEQRLARDKRKHGIVIALHGSVPDLPQTLKNSALESLSRIGMLKKAIPISNSECKSFDDIAPFLSDLREFCIKQKLDHIAILWDEFGKHLEALIVEGRTSDLIAVQQLSEYVSRSKKIPSTLTLFMHQGLMRYASNLPSSARMEWAKVGGRFKPIQYVDTSKEIYQLVAKIVREIRDAEPTKKLAQKAAREYVQLGLFKDFSVKELQDLLFDAYPLEPVALHLLPRISSRVAQNERTLFSFLYEQDLRAEISPDMIYNYFSNEMHADTSVGGTSKHWLQTESAIGKCEGSELAEKILKGACLLGMGLAGERAQVGKKYLTVASAGFGAEDEATKAIKKLIKKNLLLYRRHTDSVSIWHGTDYDLRGKVDERKNLLRNDFNYIEFLEKEAPPRPWTSIRYNVDYHVKRYFPGSYASLEALKEEEIYDLVEEGHYYDGKIIYSILRDDVEIKEAKRVAKQITDSRIIVVISSEKAPVFDAALEVKALLDLSHDYEFISQDPLLPVELHQMLDDARAYLQKMLDRLTSPIDTSLLYFGGHLHRAPTATCFRELLSKIMVNSFGHSPVIKNELLVRRQVSRPIQNARKKLVYGILEQAGKKSEFGFTESEINTPQASMFRSVLKNTGLYKPEKRTFVRPSEITDPGLQELWLQLQSFFKDPGEKNIAELMDQLQRPPYGLRLGLLPVLFAAGYKAFATSVVLKKQGVYLNDIGSLTIENICSHPEEYSLIVIKINKSKRIYLENLSDLFAFGEIQEESEDAPQKEVLRHCYESLVGWRAELPVAALRAKGVSREAAAFQQVLHKMHSPEQLFFEELPLVFGQKDLLATVQEAKRVVDELTNIISIYQRDVEKLIRLIIDVDRKGSDTSLTEIAKSWVGLFPDEIRSASFDFVSKRLCEIILDHQDSDERLIDSVALILVGKGLIHWDDTTFLRFKDRLHEQTSRMQRQVLEFSVKNDCSASVSRLLLAQMNLLYEQYVSSVGKRKAKSMLKSILEPK